MMSNIEIEEKKKQFQKLVENLKKKIDQYLHDLKKDYPNLKLVKDKQVFLI